MMGVWSGFRLRIGAGNYSSCAKNAVNFLSEDLLAKGLWSMALVHYSQPLLPVLAKWIPSTTPSPKKTLIKNRIRPINSTASYRRPAVQLIGILKLPSYEENLTWRKMQTMKCFNLPPWRELAFHFGLLKMRWRFMLSSSGLWDCVIM